MNKEGQVTALDHVAVLDAELISVNATVPVGEVPTDEATRDAIRLKVEALGLRDRGHLPVLRAGGPDAPGGQGRRGAGDPGRQHGWYAAMERQVDTGGNPYVTVWLQRGTFRDQPGTRYRVTWHTRGTGTFRLSNPALSRKLDGRGCTHVPSLLAMREAVAW